MRDTQLLLNIGYSEDSGVSERRNWRNALARDPPVQVNQRKRSVHGGPTTGREGQIDWYHVQIAYTVQRRYRGRGIPQQDRPAPCIP